MRIGKCLPPAASPISLTDIISGVSGIFAPKMTIKNLETSIKNHFGVKHCFLLSSGKAAISISLYALSKLYPHRNRVIIPAFNCYSVPSSIVNAGFKVFPCDIKLNSLQFDEKSLMKVIQHSHDILAIMPVHLFGIPSPISRINKYARSAGIPVIEDSAQAMGSIFNSKFLGTQSDVGIFSLSRGKAFSTGEGGVIITSRDDIASILYNKINSLPNLSFYKMLLLLFQNIALSLFINPELFWLPRLLPFLKLGETNYDPNFLVSRFSGLQAGIAKNWPTKLSQLLLERSKRIQFYSENLNGIKGIIQFTDRFSVHPISCIRYPIIIMNQNDREQIIAISNKKGMGITKTYPDSIDNIPQLKLPMPNLCINAHKISQSMITLPCHPLVKIKDMEEIVNIIKSVLK